MDPSSLSPAPIRTLQNGGAMDTDIVLLSLDNPSSSSFSNTLGGPSTSNLNQAYPALTSFLSTPSAQLYLAPTPGPSHPTSATSGVSGNSAQTLPSYNPVLYGGQIVTQSQGALTNPILPIPPVVRTTFPGKRETSKYGSETVLVYEIPHCNLCLSFQKHRSNKTDDVYVCSRCKVLKTHVPVKVIGNEFYSDPSALNHVCTPHDSTAAASTKIGYKVKQTLREQPDQLNRAKPVQVWQNTLYEIRSNDKIDEDTRKKIADKWCEGGLKRQRSALSKAVNANRDRLTTMTNVPDRFSKTLDGEVFLHKHTSTFHLYYSSNTLKLACAAGLHTIISDGCHDFQPKQLGRAGQFYTVHGVSRNGTVVPIMYCITSSKSKRTYTSIFKALSDAIEANQKDPKELIVVMDYEKASHAAATEIFDPAKVVGCVFHLSQALNRRRDEYGLRAFTEGKEKDDRVSSWFNQILALPFLPKELLDRTPALLTLPVPVGHGAYMGCAKFLTYHKGEWLEPEMILKWNKWLVSEHRTSNLAEAYHRKLQDVFGATHPELSLLLHQIQKEDLVSEHTLRNALKGVAPKVNKLHLARRAGIQDKMEAFSLAILSAPPTAHEISEYLLDMSQHVTHKSHKKK